MRVSRLYFLIFPVFLFSVVMQGQVLQAVVADQKDRQPISDVFVFLANSSTGTATDEHGLFKLSLQETREIVLVFSHINFELLTLEIADARVVGDTFFLRATEQKLAEAVIVEKAKPRLRTRRLKAFRKAFLGEDTDENLVRINNPVVLLFKEKDDRLEAAAKEPLIIENRILGYTLHFYLEAFELFKNGDLLYKGNTYFEPLPAAAEEEAVFQKNRLEAYRKSSRRYFSDLVNGQLDTTTYLTGFSQLTSDGEFVNFQTVRPADIVTPVKEDENFAIIINNFLTVVHQNILLPENVQSPNTSVLNQGIKNYESTGPQFAASYLRSKTGAILVNPYGKILNPSKIEEYGYWTSQRISALLPADYSPGNGAK